MTRWSWLLAALMVTSCGGGDTNTAEDTLLVDTTPMADTVADVVEDTVAEDTGAEDTAADTLAADTVSADTSDTVSADTSDTVSEDTGAADALDDVVEDAADTEGADTSGPSAVTCDFLDPGVFGLVRFEGDGSGLRLVAVGGESPAYRLPPAFEAVTACCPDACCAP